MTKRIAYLFFSIMALVQVSCKSDDDDKQEEVVQDTFIRAADMSFLPEIEATGSTYKNNGTAEDPLLTLKNAGCNTIRIRLWKDPANGHSGMAEVKTLAARVKAAGMKVWLTVHYSDTWADPANQLKPAEWEGLSPTALRDAATAYTSEILAQIKPDIFQIGNETNSGFIYPEGDLINNESGFLELVTVISNTIRQQAPDTKIMLHYAGIGESADWFFDKVAEVDYDYIGLSYYPIWHGNDLASLQSSLTALGAKYDKQVLVAETAYPFTLQWADWTNNVVGAENQLVNGYAATANGQKDFVLAVRSAVEASSRGAGFAYWGGEWIAFRGNEATDGSTWENQALWDFDHNALPVMAAFNKE
jgi:arabinogalactan endo-1,4-beta-galactosidase